jgi:hypothetical protein
MAKVIKAKPSALKLNLHFTVQFNAYIREGVGVSDSLDKQQLKQHFTPHFSLYIRGL